MSKKEPINPERATVVPDGDEVKRLRLAAGWTQESLADRAGYCKRTVENVEAGRPTQVTTLRALADALGVGLADLACAAARPFLLPGGPGGPEAPPARRPALPPHRPQQLPFRIADFLGRDDEARRLAGRLAGEGGAGRPTAVCGMGGVGKTSLAVEVGHRMKECFPAGQLFLDLGGMSPDPLPVEEAMARVIHGLRPEARLPEGPGSLRAEYRTTLAAAGRVLLVLDNAANAEQVAPLLGGHAVGVLITSRHALALSEYGVEPLLLDVLAADDAAALLRGIVGGKGTDEELRQVVEICDRLPLAVRVAGDFLRAKVDWSVPEYVAAVRGEGLRWLKVGTDPRKDVEAVLKLSAAQLRRDSLERAERWSLLAHLDGDFNRRLASQIWEAGPDDPSVRDDLSELVARSMLGHDAGSGRYRMHDLMRPIAKGLFA